MPTILLLCFREEQTSAIKGAVVPQQYRLVDGAQTLYARKEILRVASFSTLIKKLNKVDIVGQS